MLEPGHRMRAGADFTRAVRHGSRSGTRTLVCHLTAGGDSTRVGFVVPKAVGNAVVRNRVKRRLRHLIRDRVTLLDGASVVVRATPGAATATSAELAGDLDSALARAIAKAAR